MVGEIVPFGKYKGQPVELLAADRDYCEWLMAQPWFSQRFRDVYNVVINYGGQPEDTPEHNALQARLLDDNLCCQLAISCGAPLFDFPSILRSLIAEADARIRNSLAVAQRDLAEAQRVIDRGFPRFSKERDQQELERCQRQLEKSSTGWTLVPKPMSVYHREFELGGWDAIVEVRGGYEAIDCDDYPIATGYARCALYIECKPSVGDEYPSVLRQMKSHKPTSEVHSCVGGEYVRADKRVLLYDRIDANGADQDQIRRIFAASGIQLVQLRDVERIVAPCVYEMAGLK